MGDESLTFAPGLITSDLVAPAAICTNAHDYQKREQAGIETLSLLDGVGWKD